MFHAAELKGKKEKSKGKIKENKNLN